MDFANIDNHWVAFLAGLITSPHCLLMCGPLAFVILTPENNTDNPLPFKNTLAPQFYYHAARITAFTLMGVLAGSIGLALTNILQLSFIKIFPWVLVTFFLLFALGFDKLIPKLPVAKKLFSKAALHFNKVPKKYAASLLGFATPLLPCGPLYMVLWTALLSGSPLFGAEISLAFVLGTFPLMIIAGSSYQKLKAILTPKRIYFIQRSLALLAAFLIAWRTLAADGPLSQTFCCPF